MDEELPLSAIFAAPVKNRRIQGIAIFTFPFAVPTDTSRSACRGQTKTSRGRGTPRAGAQFDVSHFANRRNGHAAQERFRLRSSASALRATADRSSYGPGL